MIADLQRQLGIDASFLTQFLIFIFIFVWLRLVYLGPYLELILRREKQSGGLSDEAAKLEEAAARAEAEYQEALMKARRKAGADREVVIAEARKVAGDQVAAARSQSKEKLERARDVAAKESLADLNSLRAQVGSVSKLLVDKLMHTKVGL